MATNTGSSGINRATTRSLRSTNHTQTDAPESPRRRRTRPTTSTTAASSWSTMKQDFIKTVSGAVAELMEEHGYSRERATGAVLREISSTGGDDKTKTPQDIEIFQTMRRYGLGSERAVKAMTVSDAIARTMAESDVSALQAVTELTARLSKAKFGQQQLQNQHETVDGSVGSGAASATSSSDLDLVVVPATPAVTKKQAPDLRIKPVPSIDRLAHAHAHTRSSSFSSTKAVVGGPSATSKKAKSTNKNGKSVKSKDISKDTQQGESSRARSDSVSDIVTAKLGAEKTDADKTVKNAPTATPASVRAKRGRGEDSEVTASTHKRSRQSHKDA